jgi:hypothetical protein
MEGNRVALFYLDINDDIPLDFFMDISYSKSNELIGKIYCKYEITKKSGNESGELLLQTLSINKYFNFEYDKLVENAQNLKETPYDMRRLFSIKIPDEQSNIWTYFPRLNQTIYDGGNSLYNKYLYPPNDTFFALYINLVCKDRLQDVESELPNFVRQITKGIR